MIHPAISGIICEHTLLSAYLKKKSNPPAEDEKAFIRAFHKLQGQLVLTNYRLLFIPKVPVKHQGYWES